MKISKAELLVELSQIIQDARERAAELEKENHDLLNEKPNEKSWSILEVFEHLNYYNEFYIPEIENQLKNAEDDTTSGEFSTGLFGNYAANSMLPKAGVIKNKMSTLPDKNPSGSLLDKSVLQTFVEHMDRFKKSLKLAEEKNLTKAKCRLTLPILKFKLGDGMRFFVYHLHRHMKQVERVYDYAK